jgi:aminoglycoside phosphotransferase (APT) family kinase protein
MYSFSKIQLTAQEVDTIIKAQFGSQRKLCAFQELKEGLFNAAALLELDDGLKCVIKAAPPADVKVMRYEKDILRAEVESMRLVRAQTSVPIPDILAYDPSRSLLPSEYFLMTYLPGVSFHHLRRDLSAEQQALVQHEMGRLTRAISKITGPAFGLWSQPEPVDVPWRACFLNMVENVLLDGEESGVELPLPYAEIRRRIAANSAVFDEVTTPRLVHWDLWDGNIFVDPVTAKITGLIDFERVLWGDPLIEGIFIDLNPDSQAVQGFGGDVLSSPNQQTRRRLYNTYLYLIMVIECAYRHYETNDQENWVRPQLAEILDSLQ